MRFLLVHQHFATPEQGGGTRHYEFAQHCLRRGHDFTVVASTLSYLSGGEVKDAPTETNPDEAGQLNVVRVPVTPALHRNFAWRVFCFLQFMWRSLRAALRAGPVDLVMGTTPPIFQAVSAWCVAAWRRRPFLLEVRDLWPDFAIEMGVLRGRLAVSLARALERFLYRRATHILVNSPAYRELIAARGVAPEKITLIPNGVDPGMFDPEAAGQAFRDRHGLGEAFVVAYAGALGPANDIPQILRAAERLRGETDVRFVLAGDGKDRPALEQTVRELGLSNVLFTGRLSKAEVAECLAASDACVATLQDVPGFRTTYPNKVFDYMAAGRPIVLAIDGVIREVVEAAGCGIFVKPNDEQAMTEAVLQLKCDPGLAQQMGRSGREHVVAHFNRVQQADAFADLLARLARVE